MSAAKKLRVVPPVAVIEEDPPDARKFSSVALAWRARQKAVRKMGVCMLKGCNAKSYAPRGVWCKLHKKALTDEIVASRPRQSRKPRIVKAAVKKAKPAKTPAKKAAPKKTRKAAPKKAAKPTKVEVAAAAS